MDPARVQKYKRLKRYEITRRARFLTFSCFQNQRFLVSDRACTWLAQGLERALFLHGIDLWAYCFMPTHAHLLVFPRSDTPSIADFLESTKKSVTKRALAWVRANAPLFLPRMRDEQPNGRVSHRFWQRGGGYDRNLWSDRAIWNTIDYIHRNPVADGLVQHSIDWKWSSARCYLTREPGPLNLELRRRPARP